MSPRWEDRVKEHVKRYQDACKSYSGSDYERAEYPDDLLYHFSFWQEIKPNPFNDHPIKFCADDYAEIYHSPQFQRLGDPDRGAGFHKRKHSEMAADVRDAGMADGSRWRDTRA